MRFKSAVVLLLIVVIGTTPFSVTGQEEPLPAIQAKGSVTPLTPSIVLPAEPVAAPVPPPTLEDRARANDFVTFDALYRDAVRRGDSVAPFATLHALWTYGITDPIGAFYDREIYDRLARAYPSYATFIAEYRIVDSNGNVFYPTSETRTFLLDRALEGTAPSVQLADLGSSTQRTELRTESTARSVWDRSAVASQRSTASPRRSSTTAARSGTPASSPAGTAKPALSRGEVSRRRAAPAKAIAATPVPAPKAAARDAAAPAGGDAGVPPAVTAPVVVDQAPVVAAPTTATAEAPVVVRAEEPPAAVDAPVTAAPQPIAADNNFGGRGVLLLVIGLIGAGLLAMMLRAPREVPASIMQPPPNAVPPGDKPSGPTPVEPLRRPSAAPEPPPPEKNRASGSHG